PVRPCASSLQSPAHAPVPNAQHRHCHDGAETAPPTKLPDHPAPRKVMAGGAVSPGTILRRYRCQSHLKNYFKPIGRDFLSLRERAQASGQRPSVLNLRLLIKTVRALFTVLGSFGTAIVIRMNCDL